MGTQKPTSRTEKPLNFASWMRWVEQELRRHDWRIASVGGSGGGGTGGPPTGPAGGSLSGNYPNPGIAAGAVGNTELAANAVTTGKIADGTILLADLSATLQQTIADVAVDVQDENVPVVTNAAVLDFQGAGVTVTPGGAGEAVVTIPGGGSGGSTFRPYLYGGASGIPTTGRLIVENIGGQERTIRVHKTDNAGVPINLSILLPGDDVTITDDPVVPPITGFARFTVLTDVVDGGTFWEFNALRTDVSGTPVAPAIGTPLRFIVNQSGSGGGVAAPQHMRRVSTGGNVIPHNSTTTLVFASQVESVGSITYTPATGEFTVTEAGRYVVSFGAGWPAAAAGRRTIFIAVNGVAQVIQDTVPSGTIPNTSNITATLNLAAGDVVTARVQQTTGTGLTATADGRTFASITLAGGPKGDPGEPSGGPFAMAAGALTATCPAANAGTSVAITFPVGRFTVPPVIQVTGTSNGFLVGTSGPPTVAGATVRIFNPTGATPTGCAIHWVAVQMTATTASG